MKDKTCDALNGNDSAAASLCRIRYVVERYAIPSSWSALYTSIVDNCMPKHKSNLRLALLVLSVSCNGDRDQRDVFGCLLLRRFIEVFFKGDISVLVHQPIRVLVLLGV